jgi:hypothetical protein
MRAPDASDAADYLFLGTNLGKLFPCTIFACLAARSPYPNGHLASARRTENCCRCNIYEKQRKSQKQQQWER